jgi:hypothetical protein
MPCRNASSSSLVRRSHRKTCRRRAKAPSSMAAARGGHRVAQLGLASWLGGFGGGAHNYADLPRSSCFPLLDEKTGTSAPPSPKSVQIRPYPSIQMARDRRFEHRDLGAQHSLAPDGVQG